MIAPPGVRSYSGMRCLASYSSDRNVTGRDGRTYQSPFDAVTDVAVDSHSTRHHADE